MLLFIKKLLALNRVIVYILDKIIKKGRQMAQKGSKYKRKHTVEESDRAAEEEREIAEKPYMAILYHKAGYVEDFYNLSVEDAGRAYEILAKLANDTSKSRSDLTRNAAQKLEDILYASGFQVARHDGNFLHKQEVLTIRMDFYGTIDRINPGLRSRELSSYYLYLLSHPLKKRPKTVEYDFENSPSWKLFSRFQSFRRIEKNLKVYLIKRKIDPQILQLMTPRDFSDLVVLSFQKNQNEPKVTFEKDISVRNEFVRDLARRQGDEMADMLLKQGWDERYVRSMLNMMRRYGKYNSAKLVITETNFTERVLSDLKRAGITSKEFKLGAPIPQVLTDYLIDGDKGHLIIARDKNGRKLNGADFPSFEVHHKYAVSDAGDLKSVSYVNYKENLCLVTSEIHSLFIHRCDKAKQRGDAKSYSKRLEFIDSNTAFMIGFKPSERMAFDFNKAKRTKRKVMDDRHIVDYRECMKELEQNQAAYDRKNNKEVFNAEEIIQHYKSFNSHRKVNKQRKMLLKKVIIR